PEGVRFRRQAASPETLEQIVDIDERRAGGLPDGIDGDLARVDRPSAPGLSGLAPVQHDDRTDYPAGISLRQAGREPPADLAALGSRLAWHHESPHQESAARALRASTGRIIPYPQRLSGRRAEPSGLSAVSLITFMISRADTSGCAAISSAAQPATCGVAIEVPSM